MPDDERTTEASTASPGQAPSDRYLDALRRFSGDLRMIRQVHESMRERNVPVERHHHELLLKAFLDNRDLPGAANIIDEMAAAGHPADPSVRWRLVVATSRTGATARALDQADALHRDGIAPPDDLAPDILSLYAAGGRFPAARAVLRQMAGRGQAASDTDYARLVEDCLRRRAVKDSLSLVEAMRQVGHVPTTRQATDLVVALAGAGHHDRAKELRDALVDTGAELAIEAFESVLVGAGRAGDIAGVAAELEAMSRAGHVPTSYHHNTLARTIVDNSDADTGWEAVEALPALPASGTLEALLTKTIEAGNRRRALGIIDWMLMLGIPVPLAGASAVIDQHLKARELDVALEVLRDLRRHRIPVDRRSARRVVDGLLKAKRLDDALALLEELRVGHVLTHGQDYATILGALGRAGRVEEAVGLLGKMLEGGIAPTVSDASRLVSDLVRDKRLADARALLDVLATAGIGIDEPTYRALLWAFAQANDAEAAHAVFERMVAAGITPDDRHTKALQWASGEVRTRLTEAEIEEAEERLIAESQGDSDGSGEDPSGEAAPEGPAGPGDGIAPDQAPPRSPGDPT